MADAHNTYEIRCPLHGFIPINDWEREIINHRCFQRLRRIRQLGWTDQVYPGAMHTRFEHSLGVMHIATRFYEALERRSTEALKREMAYNEDGLRRDKILVRLATLLHDVGHTPFSHAGEELYPLQDDGQTRYKHEGYSAAIIRTELREVIENHPLNQNYHLKAEEIAALLEGSSGAGRAAFWRELIDGQLDADRLDYLLRDSLHAGVDYGRFDWRRLIGCVEVVPGSEGRGPRIGVGEGGFHAAEALVLARYFMFTQVYFHKTRVAFDHHLHRAMKEILPSGFFPPPTANRLREFLAWDDWKVLGALHDGKGGEHGRRLAERDHYREVYHTPESPNELELERVKRIRMELGDLIAAEERADKSWYKVGKPDIPVVGDNPGRPVLPLSEYSEVVKHLAPVGKTMLYCRNENADAARERIQALMEEGK